jgi:hypothetical protein
MIATVPQYGEKEPKKADSQFRRMYYSLIQYIIDKAENEEKLERIERFIEYY